MPPRVSVIIPCYDAECSIGRAIASVRAQGVAGVEIIVVDDASRDGSAAAVRRLGADITLIRLPENRGASHARNVGIGRAAGDLVAFLDADDEWLPGKLARQTALLDRSPDVALVATGAWAVSEEGLSLGPVFPPENPPAAGREAWRSLLAYPSILTSSVVVRRAVLDRVGGFDTGLTVAEDQDMWVRIALEHPIAHIDDILVVKHYSSSSLSSRNPFGGVSHALPMVLRHVERNRQRLTPEEIRRILGTRLTLEGRNAYYTGLYWPGFRMLSQAIMMAHQPLSNALFMVKHAPPVRWLRRGLAGQA